MLILKKCIVLPLIIFGNTMLFAQDPGHVFPEAGQLRINLPSFHQLDEGQYALSIESLIDGHSEMRATIAVINEYEEQINATFHLLENDSLACSQSFIVSEWSSADTITGFANCIQVNDGNLQLTRFNIANGNASFQIIDTMSGYSNYIVTYAYNANTNEIALLRGALNSNVSPFSAQPVIYILNSHQSLPIQKFRLPIDKAATSLTYLGADLYVSFAFDAIARLDLQNENIADTVYLHGNSSDVHQRFEKLVGLDNRLFASGYIKKYRSLSQRDFDISLTQIDLQANADTSLWFGSYDTLAPNVFVRNEDSGNGCNLATTSDGNLLLAGTLNSNAGSISQMFYAHEASTILLAKLTPDFSTIWQKRVSAESESRFVTFGIWELTDGGAIVFSLKLDWKAQNDSSLRMHILRLKPDGTIYTLDAPLAESPTPRFSVYPNPAKTMIHIESSENITILRIIDTHGRLVAEPSPSKIVDVSLLEPGLYFIEANHGKPTMGVRKFVKTQ